MTFIPIPPTLLDPSYDLDFDPAGHRYTYCGEILTSVTQVLKSYQKPFDGPTLAAQCALRRGVTAESLLAEWARVGEEASSQGNAVHEEGERIACEIQCTNQVSFTPKYHNEEHLPKIRGLWNWFMDHWELSQGWMCPELRVAWPEYQLAGTVDLVASNYNGVPAIIDYKTNKTIDIIGGYRNLLPPFQRGKLKLRDINFTTYALQLNAYRRILAERYDFHAERMVLVHLEGRGRYAEYDVPVMDTHIDKILEARE